jgi:hypothetical protein
MPIRFRCVYCNQLLGISRRKAGTIVRCTTCDGQLIVPDPNDVATEPAETKEPGPEGHPLTQAGGGGLFEQSDFDAMLEPVSSSQRPAAVASAPAPAAPPLTKRPAGPQAAPPRTNTAASSDAPVLMLTRSRLTIVCVLLVLGLGLAFASGLIVGLSLH